MQSLQRGGLLPLYGAGFKEEKQRCFGEYQSAHISVRKFRNARSLSHVRLFVTPWTVAPPGCSVHVDFSRQEYWRGLPFPPPRDLPNPGIEFRSPALQAGAFLSEPFILPPPQSNQEDSECCAQSHSEDIFCYVFRDSADVSGRTGSIFFLISHHGGKPRVFGRQRPEVLRDVCRALHGKINICFLRSYHLLNHQPLVSSCHPGNPALLHRGAPPLGCWRWGLRFKVCRAQVFNGS